MKKKSFAMLFAIIFIVVIGTIGLLMLYFSSVTLKHTTDNYLATQGELFAESAAEFSMQVLEARDYAKYGCVDRIDINTSLYELNVTFHYFLTNCDNCNNCSVIKTKESNGTVMMNIAIKSKTESIRFFRQVIQKP